MLSAGNTKLGTTGLIWTFSLPSRTSCPGRSALCERHCYASLIERRRPSVRHRYERNQSLSRRRDFVPRMIKFILDRHVRIVRLHVGGDFYCPAYCRKWLAIMRQLPEVRFYFYTRSWRVPAIYRSLVAMARLPNVRAWLSCDRDTGVPQRVPTRFRLAWLMASPDDLPPQADLVFRLRSLRRRVQKHVRFVSDGGQALVCPVENGITGHRTSCEQCGVCWRQSQSHENGRTSLLMIDQR